MEYLKLLVSQFAEEVRKNPKDFSKGEYEIAFGAENELQQTREDIGALLNQIYSLWGNTGYFNSNDTEDIAARYGYELGETVVDLKEVGSNS